jgi:prevent-host-death family protein
MPRRMTTAEARRDWAKVLRSAERGTPVEVMRNGQPVAAVISIEQYRSIGSAGKETLSDVIAQFRASVDPADLEGPDPWEAVRDASSGRDIDLGKLAVA